MMDNLSQLWRRLLFDARRDQFDCELEEEMRFHLEVKMQENAEIGMETEEALYAAQRQFGNKTLLREVSRDMWGFRLLETLARNLRYGLRVRESMAPEQRGDPRRPASKPRSNR